MATAQLLTLTHGVDDKVTRIDDDVKGVGDKVIRIDDEVKGIGGKVNNIGDTVRIVQEGAQYIMFSCASIISVYANRWKRDENNRATDGKRSDCNHAPYGRQRQRSEEFVNPNYPNPVQALTPNTIGSQWRQDLRKWFSAPDPSTNHIIQCGAQHQGTANWFFRGSLFEEWKSTGSLLWIHGKRMSCNLSLFPFLTKHFRSGIREKCPLVRPSLCACFSRDPNPWLALRSSRIS